jgi:hypothetical protein
MPNVAKGFPQNVYTNNRLKFAPKHGRVAAGGFGAKNAGQIQAAGTGTFASFLIPKLVETEMPVTR